MPNLSPPQRKKIEGLMADPRYWNANHPDHAQALADVQKAFREAYPEPPTGAPAGTIHVRGYTRRQDGRVVEVAEYDRAAPTGAEAPVKSLSLSDKGRNFIKAHEKLELGEYKDQALHPTIGYGHLVVKGETFSGNLTQEQAEKLLDKDIAIAAGSIHRNVKVDLTQPQFDALVSFVYNVGSGNFARSTLLRKLNAGDFQGAADEFPKWDKETIGTAKVPSRGLKSRHQAERELFLYGVYR